MANFRGGYFLNGNNYSVPNMVSVPEVTPNINDRILPPQIVNHLGIPPNVHSTSCGDPCPLHGNNPRNFSTLHTAPQQQRVYELFEFPGYKVELVITPINNHQFAQSMNAPPIGSNGQTLSSQSEISQGSLNSCGNTNNSIQSYMSDYNNYRQQPFVTTNPQNYQNCYSPSQQQQQQTRTYEAPAFVEFIPDNNQQSNYNNVNNF